MAGDGEVDVDDHLFYLTSRPMYDFGVGTDHLIEGLVSDFDGTLAIMAGVAAGPVRIHVNVVKEEPEPVSSDPDIGYGRLLTVGPLYFYGPNGDTFQPGELSKLPPDAYGVRVLARGRDKAWDALVDKAVEDYEVDIWPLGVRQRFALLQRAQHQSPGRSASGTTVRIVHERSPANPIRPE